MNGNIDGESNEVSENANEYTISVCIPIYYKANTEIVRQSIDSVINQTYKPSEIVCILDKPSSKPVDDMLKNYIKNYPKLFRVVSIERDSGFGAIANIGIKNASCPFVARMDSDDISKPDRFEKEIQCFKEDPDLSIVGSNIAEFIDDSSNIIAYRKVPLDDEGCKRYLRTRDPFNHMTVLMKKSEVLRAGNYNVEIRESEDSYLYTDMYAAGCKFKNLSEVLVYARTGKDMYSRRRGKKTYKYLRHVAKHKYETGLISYLGYLRNVFVNYVVSVLMPSGLRSFVYVHFLRN